MKKFGNGTSEQILYDKAGRVTVKTQKNDRGDLLWGEGYVYGSDGKRTATVDNQSRVTLYEYNNKGQLSSVYYPYTQEMINNLKEEAESNGLSANFETGENRFLTSAEKSSIVPLLNSMQYGLAYTLTNLQIFIKESYSYDRNGNRTAKITPYGKIEYTYDRENCLLSSGSKGQAFINYNYDAMGNLLTEESAGKTTKYAYNAQNRLVYCEVTDRANKEYAQTIYAYDAFGRRIIVQDKGEAALRTLYDGLTFDIIKHSPTFENGLFTDSQNTGIKFGSTGRPTGDRYRYLGDDEAKDNNRYFYLDENTYKTANSRYKGERTTINVNGTLAAQATTEGTDYFSTDILGSVTSITDTYGSKKSGYTYDAFGTLVQGNLTGTTDHGYLGKQNDPTSRLYNYGYRDYKPQTARFTTVDPIRDGTNWFVYCNGDPLNFIDFWGLDVSDLAEVSNGIATPVGETWNDAQGVTSTWGYRAPYKTGKGTTSEGHRGMDFRAPEGTRINSIKKGRVTRVETDPDNPRGYGLYVEITHDDGTHSLYGHQSKIIVKEGQIVEAGQKIGEVGSTGLADGPHLHLGYDGNKDGIYSWKDKEDNPDILLYAGGD